MKRELRQFLSFIFFIPLVAALVFCCNPKYVFGLNSKADQKTSICCIHKNKTTSPAGHTDDCCALKQLHAISPEKVSVTPSESVDLIAFVKILIPASSHLFEVSKLAYLDGPPGPVSDAPVYLQFHTFRI